MTTSITGQGISVCLSPDDELSLTSKKPAQNKVITEEIENINNALNAKQDAPSSPGTAGQVLGLDDQLQSVWVTGGGGDVSACAPVIINTASGDIASFTDGADNRQIKKVVGTIVPVQDLHGQDAPYPAGGSKNKFDGVYPDIASTIKYRAINIGDGTFTMSSNIPLTPNNNAANIFFLAGNVSSGASTSTNGVYANHSITATAVDGYITVAYRNFDTLNPANYNTQIESGSSATSFVPYSNECPISGWTGANIEQRNANLWDEQWVDGTISAANGTNYDVSPSTIRSTTFCSCKGGVTYYTSYRNSDTNIYPRIFWYDATQTYIGYANLNAGSLYKATAPSNAAYFKITVIGAYGTTYNNDVAITASATSVYAPYHGQTLPINWQDEAGTVYGGTVTLNEDGSVDVVAEYVSVSLTGNAIRSLWTDEGRTSQGFYTNGSTWGYEGNYPTPYCIKTTQYGDGIFDYCKTAGVYNTDNWWVAQFLFTSGLFNRFEIRIPRSTIGDGGLSGAQAYLNAHPLQAVYRIEPTTYHFDNIGQLYTYLGTNNVWVDTGAITECDYLADTKLYIDSKIAEAIAAL